MLLAMFVILGFLAKLAAAFPGTHAPTAERLAWAFWLVASIIWAAPRVAGV